MIEMNYNEARFNMVEQQVRTWSVLDADVLNAMEQLPREDFVPAQYKHMAYADLEIPLGDNQLMMHPKLQAHAVQALDIKADSKILEIGTGSGYLTALLATLGGHVDSVDINPAFQKAANKRLQSLNINNVTMIEGDASAGWGENDQYDGIVISGSLPELPEQFKKALRIDGHLFAIVGEGIIMRAIVVHRSHGDNWDQKSLFETEVPALVNAEKPQKFVF